MTDDLRRLRELVDGKLSPVLAGWEGHDTIDEHEIDVDTSEGWELATYHSPAYIFQREDEICVRLLGIHLRDGKVRLGSSLLIRDAYFYADEIPATLVDHLGVARDRIEGVSERRDASDGDGLVEVLRTKVLPWFARVRDPASLLTLLDEGEEFEQVTAALIRGRHDPRRGSAELAQILARSRSSAAWHDCYRRAAARVGFEVPRVEPVVEPATNAAPPRRAVEHAELGWGEVVRELGADELEIEFAEHGRKIVPAASVTESF